MVCLENRNDPVRLKQSSLSPSQQQWPRALGRSCLCGLSHRDSSHSECPVSRRSTRSRILVTGASDKNPHASVCSRRCKGSVQFCSFMAKTRSLDGGKKPPGRVSKTHTDLFPPPAGEHPSDLTRMCIKEQNVFPLCDAVVACE
jgi:hypothetical protein